MGAQRTFQQQLVLITAACAVVLFTSAALYYKFRIPDPIAISTQGQPTVGFQSAPVEAVIFEDFLCDECREFNETIFPKLETQYIASHRLRYTFVPVSFLPGSKPLANAALAVFNIAPERFFSYAHALFHKFTKGSMEGSQRTMLLDIAREIGGIDERALRQAIDSRIYYAELDDNLHWAQRLMGVDFGTPSLYINGVATPTSSFQAVQARIERAAYLINKESR